jgi:autotransporter-associated beta strand protein
VAVLGITGAGASTFGGGHNITLGRGVTLQASNAGTVTFANNWVNASGPVAFTIGSDGNAGVVVLESELPTSTGVSIVRGTARLQTNTDNRINSATPVTIGSSLGSATLDINGQSQTLSNLSFAGNSGSIIGGTLRLATSPNVAVEGTGHVISSLVALEAAASFNVNAASRLQISSAISGNSFGLTKTGAGILELSGQNTYIGDTTVSAGTLVVNGSLGAGNLSVAAGATLMGSGTVGGPATIAGIHSPGNSPGIETFSSNLTYSSGSSQVVWELWGNTNSSGDRGSLYDGINVGGNLDFAGATSLLLDFGGTGVGVVNWNDTFWDSPQTWTLFSVTTGTTTNFGNFSLVNSPASWFDSNGLAFSNSSRSENTFSVSQSGNNVVVTYTVIVPEPGAIALAGIGIAAAAWAYRRRRS